MTDIDSLVLEPRLSGFGYDDKELQKDLGRLIDLVNKKGGLKLKLTLDASDNSVLKETDKRIEEVTKLINSKLDNIKKSGTGKIKLSDIGIETDVKALENISAQAKQVVKDSLSIVEAINSISDADIKTDISKRLSIDKIQDQLVNAQTLVETVADRINTITFKTEIETPSSTEIQSVTKDVENKAETIKIKAEVITDKSLTNIGSTQTGVPEVLDKVTAEIESKIQYLISSGARYSDQLKIIFDKIKAQSDEAIKNFGSFAVGGGDKPGFSGMQTALDVKNFGTTFTHGNNEVSVSNLNALVEQIYRLHEAEQTTITDAQKIKTSVDAVRNSYEEYIATLSKAEKGQLTKALNKESQTSIFAETEIVDAKRQLESIFESVANGIPIESKFAPIQGLINYLIWGKENALEMAEALQTIKVPEQSSQKNNSIQKSSEVNTKAINAETEATEQLAKARKKVTDAETPKDITAPETSGFEKTNAVTDEHINLMEEAAKAELEKLEISKRLEQQLSSEEQGFNKLGKAIDDVESKKSTKSEKPAMSTGDFSSRKDSILAPLSVRIDNSDVQQRYKLMEDLKVSQLQLKELSKESNLTEKQKDEILRGQVKLQMEINNLKKQDTIQKQTEDEKSAYREIVSSIREIQKTKWLPDDADEATDKLKALKITYKEIESILTGAQKDTLKNMFSGAEESIAKTGDNAKDLARDYENLIHRFEYFKKNASAAVHDSKFGSIITQFETNLRNAAAAADATNFKPLSDELKGIELGAKAAGLSALTMGDLIHATFKRLLSYNLANTLIGNATRGFQQAVSDIKDIDDSLTQLSKVVNITRDDFKKLTIEALEAANKWGRTASEYLLAQEAFAKAGVVNYKQFADLSVQLQAAGDISSELSNDFIKATNAAFKLGYNVENITSVLDSMNQVTNRNSVSMNDLAVGVKNFANTANVVGESVQSMTALIATGVGATEKAPEEVSRALRTLALNIAQVKGEVDGEIIDEKSMAYMYRSFNVNHAHGCAA